MKRFCTAIVAGMTSLVHLIVAQPSTPVTIDLVRGKQLYEKNCKTCHGINEEIVGPALPSKAGLAIDKQDPTWVIRWIQNSQALVKSHDPRAEAVFNQYNQIEMPAFKTLTAADIRDIGAYTLAESHRLDSLAKAEASSPQVVQQPPVAPALAPDYGQYILVFVAGMALVILVIVVLVVAETAWVVVGKNQVRQARSKSPTP